MSSDSADEVAHTALDEAYGRFIAGDAEGALRLALSVLEPSPPDAKSFQIGAGLLVVRVLAKEHRGIVAAEVAARLVDAFVRRGDLSSAVVAARAIEECGEDAKSHFATIAAAFGKGSARVSEVSQAPPPLPTSPGVSPALEMLKGAPLRDRTEIALAGLLAQDDPVAADSKVPRLPLVGGLIPRALERMLASLTVRDAAAGSDVLRQGEEGREAFFVVRGAVRVTRHGDEEGETVLAQLGPGAIFGEMALVSDSPRAAGVTAIEEVTLLVASREVLEQIAKTETVLGAELATFCRGRMVANLLRHSAILGAVAPREREELIGHFETRTFAAGDHLVHAGADAEGLFLIASGTVRVTSRDEDGDTILLARLGPGDVVGEISLVLRRPATADVIAEHTTIALELRREEFQTAIKEHPTLLGELYELATKREEETRSVVAQEALDASDFVLV